MAARQAENIQTLSQVPPCPLCHQADQVQPLQTAYERGSLQFQPPPTPRRIKALLPWIIAAVVLYGGAQLFLFVQLGGNLGFGSWPLALQILEVGVIEVVLLIGLAASVLVFGHLINTRRESVWQYPGGDQNREGWRNFYHCRRDNAIFDGRNQTVLSPFEARRLVRVLPPEPGHPTVEDR